MSGQHTQGRLAARFEYLMPEEHLDRKIGGSTNKERDFNEYAHIVGTIDGKYHNSDANRRRLAACWNACDHLDTDHIERIAEVGVASVIVTADIHRKDCEAALRELAAARALLEEASKRQHTDSWEAALGQNTLDDRIRAFLKGGA